MSNKFEGYIIEAHRLKLLYADQIELLVGIESEFINEEGLQLLVQLLQKHEKSIEYIVGSVHHCHEKPIDFDKPTFDKTLASIPAIEDSEKLKILFESYFDAQFRLMQVLKPEVIGHFDLCRLYYPETRLESYPSVWKKVERNLRFAIDYGALIEINASAFRKGWKTAYPGAEILDVRSLIAENEKKANNHFKVNCHASRPADVIR